MRTAEAAGATAFVATAATADPFGWKALRGSMGSALRLPIARGDIEDVLAAFRKARHRDQRRSCHMEETRCSLQTSQNLRRWCSAAKVLACRLNCCSASIAA